MTFQDAIRYSNHVLGGQVRHPPNMAGCRKMRPKLRPRKTHQSQERRCAKEALYVRVFFPPATRLKPGTNFELY